MERIIKYVDFLMEGKTPETSNFNIEAARKKSFAWNYVDGVACKALLSLYKIKKNKKILAFVDNYMGSYISDDGLIKGYKLEDFNLDFINSGKVLFTLYDLTKKAKYKKAIDILYNQIIKQPRIKAGNFWHKKIYANQVWLDGIYMCLPFYMDYETRYTKLKGYNDIYNQVLNVEKLMKEKINDLPSHAYDETKSLFWSDKKTGLSHTYWSRSIGWYLMSLVDMIDIMDEMIYDQKREYQEILQRNLDAVIKHMDKKTGMLYQVMDQGDRKGNYLETSSSAMLAYTILKAVRLDLLPKRYLEKGKKVFNGILDEYFSYKNGKFTLGGICLVAGLGPEDRPNRDGTFEYYISEPVVENDGKGVGPFLLAYVEILRSEE